MMASGKLTHKSWVLAWNERGAVHPCATLQHGPGPSQGQILTDISGFSPSPHSCAMVYIVVWCVLCLWCMLSVVLVVLWVVLWVVGCVVGCDVM